MTLLSIDQLFFYVSGKCLLLEEDAMETMGFKSGEVISFEQSSPESAAETY